MTLEELRRSQRDAILAVANRHGVVSIRVFGSFARGDAAPDSDLDLLVRRGAKRTPFFPGGFVADLEDLLGRRVDVVTESGLPTQIRERVISEAVPL